MFSEEELASFYSHLNCINSSQAFPAEDELQRFLDNSLCVLENEDSSYRPLGSDCKPGGLLDFSASDIPVVIVPDIHARAEFILRILDFKIDGRTVLQLLNEKKIYMVCVGDAFHSESRGYERWLEAYKDWSMNVYAGQAMQQEMLENIFTLMIIMELKNAFTANFHFLKGNHENILNETCHGNFSFRKFVQEGIMCCDFIRQVYGDVVLHLISLWEKALPVCAVFSDFGVSHAEPAFAFSRNQIIDYHKNDDVVIGLTWTANDEAEEQSVQKLMENLNPSAKKSGVIWFGGHRPVKDGKFFLRQNGRYLQLHNPDEMNIAVAVPGKIFDPVADIKSVL
ncbi:metallophosphoesterase [Treponema sp.]|uniref:metallophosphoesterase n=1 Tax=Treponema sp. TaxID=166 RepID=UPI003F062A32